MPAELFQRYQVVDVDTHLTEPPDLWTSRVSSKWGEAVPHVENVRGNDIWVAAGNFLNTPGNTAIAGWDGYVPDGPRTYDEIPPSAYDAGARLAHMDVEGIYAQVLYPNVAGFGSAYFLKLGDRELVTACVRAYNDFLVEWTSTDPSRLIPVMSTPFWDLDFAIAELERCVENGHKAMNFCNHPESHGEPPLSDPHWDRLWAAAQDAEVPVTLPHWRRRHHCAVRQGPASQLPGEVPQDLCADDHGQHRDARRPRLRRCVSSLPGAALRLGGVGRRLDTRCARDVRLAVGQQRDP